MQFPKSGTFTIARTVNHLYLRSKCCQSIAILVRSQTIPFCTGLAFKIAPNLCFSFCRVKKLMN